MPADIGTTDASVETDRMRLIDAELRKSAGTSLRDYLKEAWNDGKGEPWDNIALNLRNKLAGTPYAKIPRETVIQYARRYGVAPARPTGMARVRRSRPVKA